VPIRSHDKTSFKLPLEMVIEMRAEAKRLQRSLSWVAQEAWRRARAKIKELPPHSSPR
jgi:uncharacterized small protein (TIGR04563 family)